MESDEKISLMQERVPKTAEDQPPLQEGSPFGGSNQNIYGRTSIEYSPFTTQAHSPGDQAQQGAILPQEHAL